MTPPTAGAAPELSILFASVDGRALDVVTFVDALSRLCRGALAECDLGASSTADHCVCVARFRGPVPDAISRRLEFWAWRLGGTASRGSRLDPGALRACDLVLRQVPPGLLFGAVRRMLGRFLGPSPDLVRGRLSLRLALGTPETAGLVFDRRGQQLFVPSPRLPPIGEAMSLEVQLPGGEIVAAEGVVSRTREPGQDGPGSPAGFVVGLVTPEEALMRALESGARDAAAAEQRRAPRYPVRALATVKERADAPAGHGPAGDVVRLGPGAPADAPLACVENLSQGGAFVRTAAPVAKGAKVELEMTLPGGVTAGVPGTVVHVDERGIGIRFEADPARDAAIGSALAHVAVTRRRALVVDDDLLCRRMMADALGAQGFEVFSAADGTDGLRTLIDVLLDLSLLIVDFHMPGLDGEKLLKLVRQQGGERDLTVVVMSGDIDGPARQRLTAAGADAVLPKSEGMAKIADAAVRALLRRERSTPEGVRGLDMLA